MNFFSSPSTWPFLFLSFLSIVGRHFFHDKKNIGHLLTSLSLISAYPIYFSTYSDSIYRDLLVSTYFLSLIGQLSLFLNFKKKSFSSDLPILIVLQIIFLQSTNLIIDIVSSVSMFFCFNLISFSNKDKSSDYIKSLLGSFAYLVIFSIFAVFFEFSVEKTNLLNFTVLNQELFAISSVFLLLLMTYVLFMAPVLGFREIFRKNGWNFSYVLAYFLIISSIILKYSFLFQNMFIELNYYNQSVVAKMTIVIFFMGLGKASFKSLFGESEIKTRLLYSLIANFSLFFLILLIDPSKKVLELANQHLAFISVPFIIYLIQKHYFEAESEKESHFSMVLISFFTGMPLSFLFYNKLIFIDIMKVEGLLIEYVTFCVLTQYLSLSLMKRLLFTNALHQEKVNRLKFSTGYKTLLTFLAIMISTLSLIV